MTFADECLERAKRAYEAPWNFKEGDNQVSSPWRSVALVAGPEDNVKFIAHARLDVETLAIRLKKSIDLLKWMLPRLPEEYVGSRSEILKQVEELECPVKE